jgi:uncharacterized membrane protein affecting hemolysin expression
MAEKYFYLLIILSVVIGLLLMRIVIERIRRRQQSRHMERGLAEYLALKSSGKRVTKTRFGSDS